MLDASIYDGIESLGLSPDIRGWNSQNKFFKEVIDSVNPSVIFELGSWKGASAIHMASLCPAKIYCVDTWLGGLDHALSNKEVDSIPRRHGYPQMYFQFLYNVKHSNCHDRIIPVTNTTILGMKYLAKKNIVPQLIYIDASHEDEDVFADVTTAHRLFPKAVLFGDDFGWASVKSGLSRALSGKNYSISEDKTIWIYRP